MQLTPEQQALYDGDQGEVKAKIMKSLVLFGETFGAEKMVPVTGKYGHLVTSFGLSFLKPVFDLVQELIDDGAVSQQAFTVDPLPIDKNVPASPLEYAVSKAIYGKQWTYNRQLEKMGLINKRGYTCTCYMDEVGNIPEKGDVLSWAESSAVVYANSVLGARCNRNSGIFELFGSVIGYVPYYGFLTDEGRKATWIVEVRTTKKPEAQLLGSVIGMKVMEDVPYVRGLDRFLGTELTGEAKDYLKDFGAATASNGAVGLYHIENLTPEAKELGESLLAPDPQVYVIDDAELQRVKDSYPCIWKNPDAEPELCFLGCPHMSYRQLQDWTARLEKALDRNGHETVQIPTVFTTSPDVLAAFQKSEDYKKLTSFGVIVSYICPLMYMDNPLCGKKPVITSSNKLRTYTSSRFYSEDEILEKISGGDRK
ncbi:MAG: DUF521 domain-containing protein [Clostridia bacterium]|nr:DUF521 domain-containing protein [Clostridia bacterium]